LPEVEPASADLTFLPLLQVVELDSKRNKGREALRQLRNHYPNVKTGESQLWVCFGNTFLKMDAAACKTMLKEDLETLDAEIDKLHNGLKPKVAQLHKMEGRAEVKGFQLKGMKIDELMNTRGHTSS